MFGRGNLGFNTLLEVSNQLEMLSFKFLDLATIDQKFPGLLQQGLQTPQDTVVHVQEPIFQKELALLRFFMDLFMKFDVEHQVRKTLHSNETARLRSKHESFITPQIPPFEVHLCCSSSRHKYCYKAFRSLDLYLTYCVKKNCTTEKVTEADLSKIRQGRAFPPSYKRLLVSKDLTQSKDSLMALYEELASSQDLQVKPGHYGRVESSFELMGCGKQPAHQQVDFVRKEILIQIFRALDTLYSCTVQVQELGEISDNALTTENTLQRLWDELLCIQESQHKSIKTPQQYIGHKRSFQQMAKRDTELSFIVKENLAQPRPPLPLAKAEMSIGTAFEKLKQKFEQQQASTVPEVHPDRVPAISKLMVKSSPKPSPEKFDAAGPSTQNTISPNDGPGAQFKRHPEADSRAPSLAERMQSIIDPLKELNDLLTHPVFQPQTPQPLQGELPQHPPKADSPPLTHPSRVLPEEDKVKTVHVSDTLKIVQDKTSSCLLQIKKKGPDDEKSQEKNQKSEESLQISKKKKPENKKKSLSFQNSFGLGIEVKPMKKRSLFGADPQPDDEATDETSQQLPRTASPEYMVKQEEVPVKQQPIDSPPKTEEPAQPGFQQANIETESSEEKPEEEAGFLELNIASQSPSQAEMQVDTMTDLVDSEFNSSMSFPEQSFPTSFQNSMRQSQIPSPVKEDSDENLMSPNSLAEESCLQSPRLQKTPFKILRQDSSSSKRALQEGDPLQLWTWSQREQVSLWQPTEKPRRKEEARVTDGVVAISAPLETLQREWILAGRRVVLQIF